MLHLLPQSYINQLKKEYHQRVLVAACDLFAFCLFIFIISLIPSLVIISFEKDQLNKQSNAMLLGVSDEDKALAMDFEASVRRGMSIVGNEKSISSKSIDEVLALRSEGIRLSGVAIISDGEGKEIRLQGIADTRTGLSRFIRMIDDGGFYTVEDVPASTFTQDRDVSFSLILHKNKKTAQ